VLMAEDDAFGSKCDRLLKILVAGAADVGEIYKFTNFMYGTFNGFCYFCSFWIVLGSKFCWFKYVLDVINLLKLDWFSLWPVGINIHDIHNEFATNADQ